MYLRHLLVYIFSFSLAYIVIQIYNFDYFIGLWHFYTSMSTKLGLEKVQEKLIISQISKEWVNFLSNQSYILCYKSFIDSKLFEVERNIRFHVFHSTLLIRQYDVYPRIGVKKNAQQFTPSPRPCTELVYSQWPSGG